MNRLVMPSCVMFGLVLCASEGLLLPSSLQLYHTDAILLTIVKCLVYN